MTSKVRNHFSEAYFDIISRFWPDLVMGMYGKAIYGKAIWQSHMARPYGKAIWQSHMARPYGKAIWQSHMAEPYGSRGRGCRRGRGLAIQWEAWNYFQELYLGKVTFKNKNYTKKNRLKILYRTPYLKNRDLFSWNNFDTFLFSCNMCIL